MGSMIEAANKRMDALERQIELLRMRQKATYNQTEVASLLGITTNTLRKYIKQEKLKTTLIGGKQYISEDEIKRFINVLPPLR